jgi:hypothetical protein
MNTAVPVESEPAPVLAVPKAKKPSARKRPAKKQSPKKQPNKKQVSKAVKSKSSRKAGQVTAVKPAKQKLVRDSFTIPEAEYQILVNTKKLLTKSGVEVKKTELLRVGLLLIGKTSLTVLKRHLGGLEKLKSGRPGKSK